MSSRELRDDQLKLFLIYFFYRIGDRSTSLMKVRHTVLNPMFTVNKLYARTVLAKRGFPFKYNPYADPNRVQSLISSVQSELRNRTGSASACS